MFPKIFGGTTEDAQSPASAGDPAPDTTQMDTANEAMDVVSEEPDSSGPTKMSRATEIYRRMSRKKGATRKEIVAAFMEEVGLTKAGAATYYQMIKKGRR